MRVNEIFPAVQGEGSTMGMPTTFLRLSGCNLKCEFCDTKYHTSGKNISLNEVANRLDVIGLPVTVTGGEPLLQKGELFQLIEKVPTFKWYLETNGTIYAKKLDYFTAINCSPKKQGINIEVLKQLSELDNICFKFVYENKKDTWWEPIIKLLHTPRSKIYIMPEGADRRTQLKRMPEVIEYCLEKGYMFSARLHVIAFNKKRGV